MNLVEGEFYTVTEENELWLNATNNKGDKGWIPSNYVEVIPKSDRKEEKIDNTEKLESDKKCVLCNQMVNNYHYFALIQIMASYVASSKGKFHDECFKCSGCHQKMSGKPYLEKEENIFCQNCFAKKYRQIINALISNLFY